MTLTKTIGEFVDREFARETAFLAELVKVPSDNPPGDCAAHAAIENGDEQVVLVLEIEVDGAGGDAGGAGDVGDLGVEEAALGEDVNRGAKDGIAFRARRWVGPARNGVQRHD